MASSRQFRASFAYGRLAAAVTSGATSMTVSLVTGAWPDNPPFFLALGDGTSRYEVVSVTAINGSTFTITRAQQGTLGVAHPQDESIVAGPSDLEASRLLGVSSAAAPPASAAALVAHEADTTSIHGITDTTLLSRKPASNDSVRFVTANGNDSTGDGRSWGSALRTVTAALASFTGAGVIYLSRGTYTETVDLTNRGGIHLVGVTNKTGEAATIKTPNDSASALIVDTASGCSFESLAFLGFSTSYTGVLVDLSHSSNGVISNCTWQNTNGTATSTTGGTGLRMSNTEGWLVIKPYFAEQGLALHMVTEATENVFVAMKGASNWREILIEGVSGGNTFLFTKWNNPKDNTADPTVFQVDIGGDSPPNNSCGSNVFIVPDWSETANPLLTRSRVTSHNNVFIGGDTSPQNIMDVSGNGNLFDHVRCLRIWNISGTGNTLRRPRLVGTSIVNTGTGTVIDRPVIEAGSITYGGALATPYRVVGGALATNATSGFLYIPTCAGTPTGTPAVETGLVPMVFDTTNDKLYVFDGGAWKGGTAPGVFS